MAAFYNSNSLNDKTKLAMKSIIKGNFNEVLNGQSSEEEEKEKEELTEVINKARKQI